MIACWPWGVSSALAAAFCLLHAEAPSRALLLAARNAAPQLPPSLPPCCRRSSRSLWSRARVLQSTTRWTWPPPWPRAWSRPSSRSSSRRSSGAAAPAAPRPARSLAQAHGSGHASPRARAAGRPLSPSAPGPLSLANPLASPSPCKDQHCPAIEAGMPLFVCCVCSVELPQTLAPGRRDPPPHGADIMPARPSACSPRRPRPSPVGRRPPAPPCTHPCPPTRRPFDCQLYLLFFFLILALAAARSPLPCPVPPACFSP